jgi:hypothetical protein
MTRFGKTPHGKNLYRVVFAPSVKMLVGGKWKDGAAEYRTRPAYRHLGNEWILERWLSPEEFTGMTREQYELRYRDPLTGLFSIGPYPEKGAYMICMDAALKPEAIESIEQIIAGIEYGRNHRSASRSLENERLLAEDLARQQKAEDSELMARIRDLKPAFGGVAANICGSIHSQKSKPVVKSANELGLPVGNNKLVQI